MQAEQFPDIRASNANERCAIAPSMRGDFLPYVCDPDGVLRHDDGWPFLGSP